MKKLLLIAFYFPPFHRSSGSLRVLKFARYLPENDVSPAILTAHTRAYDKTNAGLLQQIPAEVAVHRAFALDAKRHLSIAGRYPLVLATPDRYSSWIAGAWSLGMRLIRRGEVDAILTSSPAPSAQVVGALLHRHSGIPWIADFRDPIWDDSFVTRGLHLRVLKRIEAHAAGMANRITVTTDGIASLFRERYGENLSNRLHVISNGFDEADFSKLPAKNGKTNGKLRLLHAGLLDPVDRNPQPFFHGLAKLLAESPEWKKSLKIELVAAGESERYGRQIAELGLCETVHLRPNMAYHDCLAEMSKTDALLLFQGETCDTQIPAKLYEYLRIGKPIVALTTEAGETGRLLQQLGIGQTMPPDRADAISTRLQSVLPELMRGDFRQPEPEQIRQFSRQAQAKALAALVKEVTA